MPKKTVRWSPQTHHEVESVRRYIESQENHHRRASFTEEYVRLLKENDVDYKEEFLW